MGVFPAPVVTLHDVEKVPRRIDHLAMLEEAERRIATALAKAREASERTPSQ